MIECKESEVVLESEEEYDYMNEEPLKEENNEYEYEEDEIDYCD